MDAREAAQQTTGTPAPQAMPRALVGILAVVAGATVANLYYCQPLLERMASSFAGGTPGLLASLTLLGYSLGVLLFVPLGDRIERRKLIVSLALVTSLLLAAIALAPTFRLLVAISFAMGATTVIPQIVVPYAAELSPPAQRGRAIGTVASGLLFGVLLSRVVAGGIAERFGWRSVYWGAAVLTAGLALLLRAVLPQRKPATALSWWRLQGSLWTLMREEPRLRLHAFLGAMTFAAFNAFWATLAAHLERLPAHHGPSVAGSFGLVGLVGAAAAPLVGRYSDRRGGRAVNAVAIGVLLASFAVLLAFGHSLAGISVAVVLLDFGAQANHVSNQTRIVALREDARSRLNTVYMSVYIGGGALGALCGSLAFRAAGFWAVCAVGIGFSCIALTALALARALPAGHSGSGAAAAGSDAAA
jgi:predicted MFS family arabinose efflux permease